MVLGIPFILLNGGDFHHMMDWLSIPFMGFWWIGAWIVQLILAVLVYKDSEKKDKNGLLWFILVILPWVGFLFLIVYLVVRSEESDIEDAIKDSQRILDERYAKGEITRSEYLQIKRDIEKKK